MGNRAFIIGIAALALACAAPVFAGAEGSVITWGLPTNISGDSDVSLNGSLVAAFNMNGPATTVNNITFNNFTAGSGGSTSSNGNFTFTETAGNLLSLTNLGSAQTPFANLSGNYQTLLSSAVSADENNSLILGINGGLIVGQRYLVQIWLNASSFPNSGFRTTASSPNPVTLDDNTTNSNGGLGQYVIGTFFCGSPNQFITFNGADATQAPTVNAFQVRLIPEPGSLGLFAIGSIMLAIRLRCRVR